MTGGRRPRGGRRRTSTTSTNNHGDGGIRHLLPFNIVAHALIILIVGALSLQFVLIAYHNATFSVNDNIIVPSIISGSTTATATKTTTRNSDRLPPTSYTNETTASVIDVMAILKRAGIQLSDEEATQKIVPTTQEITSLYGSNPVVVGLDTCAAFRESVKAQDRFVAPAGTFNTGTNLAATLLRRNCYIPERVVDGDTESLMTLGVRFQVPWGKHNPVSWRLHNVARQGGEGIVQTDVLPVVVIKDPVTWMSSMCRHPYSVFWKHSEGYCPNLVNGQGMAVPVRVRYAGESVARHKSLVDLWNTWYSEWYNVTTFPRLMIRFEDLLFHAEKVVKAVCDCAGGKMRDNFRYKEESAKGEIGPHQGGSGLLDSILRYGNATTRKVVLTDAEAEFAKQKLSAELMDLFHYSVDRNI